MYRVQLSIVLISCLLFFSCKQKQPPPTPPVPVNLYAVTKKHVLYYDKYPATTQALSQVTLLPQVQGYITGIYFKEGSRVKKGQKLYEIDIRLYQAAVDAAVANLRVAEGNQVQAQQDADRYVYLNSYNAVAKQLYDHAIIALDNAKNQVKAAEEAVKTAKTNLTYSVIYAPFDGTIGFSQVKLGNMVSVGQTILNTISTNDPMAVDFLVNEKQLVDFEKLEKNREKAIDSLFTLLLPNNTLYPHLGKISIIDRAVDPLTGAIRVRLVFPNPQNDLKVGMSCIVRVHNQDDAPQLLIPGKAVVEQMGEYFVFVVKDTVYTRPGDSTKKTEADTTTQKGPKLYAFQKKVILGQTINANVIVKSGVEEGDQIVSDGVQSLHDGSRVATGAKPPGGNTVDSTQKTEAGRANKKDSSKNN
jgi:membrane fusion protein (multidrug efflux system)